MPRFKAINSLDEKRVPPQVCFLKFEFGTTSFYNKYMKITCQDLIVYSSH